MTDVAGSWRARRNPLKEAMQRGEPAIAMWVTSPWLAVPEILGVAGIDGVLLDLEHVSHGVAEVEQLITAADAAGISAIVRPPDPEPSLVSRILDAGAHGIVFPRVEDAAGAELAVACTRYPPRGRRGWGGAHTRYAKWQGGYARDQFNGATADPGVYTPEYVAGADENSLVVLLIESVRGVANAAEICATEGVDAVVFGWGDYAVEVAFDQDRARAAAAEVTTAARAAGIGLGVSPGDPLHPGCFTIAGIDTLLMSAALGKAVTAARAAAEAALAVPEAEAAP